MRRMDDALATEADSVASEVERREGRRIERLRIAAHGGVAVAFYRRADMIGDEEADLHTVLLDEVSPGEWAALNDSSLRAGGSRHISMRPSERGDWIVAIYGSAPAGRAVALIEYEGEEHRTSIEDGVYAFMVRATAEPEPALTRPRFQ
jgi:hypothetical protein